MSDYAPIGCAAVAIGIILVGSAGIGIAKGFHEENITCTVSDKESVSKGKSGHEYRLYTEDCGTLKVGDYMWRGHFGAADVYGGIEPNERYDFTTIGWRVPFFSWFPNVIEATPAK